MPNATIQSDGLILPEPQKLLNTADNYNQMMIDAPAPVYPFCPIAFGVLCENRLLLISELSVADLLPDRLHRT